MYTKYENGQITRTSVKDNSLTKLRRGKPFEIDRPGFYDNTPAKPIRADPLTPNVRRGIGNYVIHRPGFESAKIAPRTVSTSENLRARDLSENGLKVQFGEKTFDEIFSVRVPDPTDVEWIAEKDRLVAMWKAKGLDDEAIRHELEVNKPLHRAQRTVKSEHNLATSQLDVSTKLDRIIKEVKEGRAESVAEQAYITGMLVNILRDTSSIENLTHRELTNLGSMFKRLHLPTEHKKMGLEPRFVDIDFYRANEGLINVFLLNRAEEEKGMDLNRPVKNFTGPMGSTIKLTSFVSLMARTNNRLFLDLERGGLINENMLMREASQLGGINPPVFSINPAYTQKTAP